jgi:hypothetical protein
MPAIIPIAVAAASSLISAGIGAATKSGGGGSAPPPPSPGGGGYTPTPLSAPADYLPAPVPSANIPQMAGGGSSLTHFSGNHGGNKWGQSNPYSPEQGQPGSASPVDNADPYGGSINPYTLAHNGALLYQAPPAPDLSGYFGGYQASQAQQTPVLSQEQALADALRNQSQGIGPSVAQQQLTNATGQNMANTMGLLAASRNAPGGLAAALAANAAAGQGSAGQSAVLRAQEEMAGQQGLGAELGTMGGQQNQVNLANMNALNQAAQFTSEDRAAMANMLQNQYQYNTGLTADQINRQNAAIYSGMGADINRGTADANYWRNVGVNAGTGGLNAAGNYVAQASSPSQPQPVPNGGSSGSGGGDDFSNNYNYNGPDLQYPGYRKGTVVNQPTVALIGEAGPEAVVPIDMQGRPALDRTKDPAVQQLLTHPDFLRALHAVVGTDSDSIPGGGRAMAGGGIVVPPRLAGTPNLDHPLTPTPRMLNALAGVGGVGSPSDQDEALKNRLLALGAKGGSHVGR